MDVDFAPLPVRERYKLLVGSIVPRPIALVSTMGLDGGFNLAPFSFFNAVCDDPPAIVLGINSGIPGVVKDTVRNIRTSGEFVVNLVDEAMAEKMNICAVDFPPETNEFDVAGFTPLPGSKVKVPYVAEAPIALECRRLTITELGVGRNVVIGEVLMMHIRDDLYDKEKNYVLADKSRLIGRMHGAGWYARTSDLFDMPRLTMETYKEKYKA